MTKSRLVTGVTILILLLSTLSCALITDPVKPTKVVDLPPMVGKSLQEMTAMLGPSREQGICYAWNHAEGVLSVCYENGDHAKKSMSSITYSLPGATIFAPGMAVGSPGEMAPFVNIDLGGKKPDNEYHGGYAYNEIILNGKTVDVNFVGGPKRIGGGWVQMK